MRIFLIIFVNYLLMKLVVYNVKFTFMVHLVSEKKFHKHV